MVAREVVRHGTIKTLIAVSGVIIETISSALGSAITKLTVMDHLFNTFMSRRTSSESRRSSCDSIPDLYTSKKRILKRLSFGSRQSPSIPSLSSSELVNVVDEQLLQIKEKLAEFREQDNYIRERMDSLSDSMSELSSSRSSLSSYTPSECSDLDSLDEVSEEEEESDSEYVGQKAFSSEPRLHRIPTVRLAGGRNQSPIKYCHMRQCSDPSSLHSQTELPKEEVAAAMDEVMEVRRHSTPSVVQAIDMYPQYNNPEDINTLF